MQSHQTSWEDEENNRIVELRVDYEIDGDSLAIKEIAPQQVTFVDSGHQVVRRIKVYGDRARRHLEQAFRQDGRLEKLEVELLQHATVNA